MALPWVRLDTAFPTNPKVLALAEDRKWQAITAYISSLAYAGAQGTNGFLPAGCLPFIHATKRIASDLVAANLWAPCPGGWDINGWADFQPSTDEHEERRKKAKAAAEARWAKARGEGDVA